jgi:hypothetical protein
MRQLCNHEHQLQRCSQIPAEYQQTLRRHNMEHSNLQGRFILSNELISGLDGLSGKFTLWSSFLGERAYRTHCRGKQMSHNRCLHRGEEKIPCTLWY